MISAASGSSRVAAKRTATTRKRLRASIRKLHAYHTGRIATSGKTAIGTAQRVALALDRSDWPEMVGNIGGDDTVFVATDSASAQKTLLARIERARS